MNQEEYERLTDKESCNKEQLKKVKYCGCTYCYSLLYNDFIEEWIDDREMYTYAQGKMVKEKGDYTAKCPFCNTDSIIPLKNKYESSIKILKEIIDYNMIKKFQYMQEKMRYKIICIKIFRFA